MTTRYKSSTSQRAHESRFRVHSTVHDNTFEYPSKLASVGQHETGGVPDAHYLDLADQMLNEQQSRKP
jgi:hypothetical protein